MSRNSKTSRRKRRRARRERQELERRRGRVLGMTFTFKTPPLVQPDLAKRIAEVNRSISRGARNFSIAMEQLARTTRLSREDCKAFEAAIRRSYDKPRRRGEEQPREQ